MKTNKDLLLVSTKNDVEEHTMSINPVIARRWLDLFKYPHQRALSAGHVRTLVREMENGQFLPYSNISIAKLNGNNFIVDGQHRLAAINKANKELLFNVIIHKVNSMDDIALLYTKYDMHRKRSQYDALSAFDLSNRLALPKKYINRCGGAMSIIMGDFKIKGGNNKSNFNQGDLASKLIEWREPVTEYYIATKSMTNYLEALLRTHVVAVGLTTMKYCQEIAFSFWNEIALDNELKRGTPQKQLADYLKFSRMAGGQRYFGVRPPDVLNMTAYCWNRYFDGKNANSKPPNDFTFNVKGTPFMVNN